jgi:dTDP-4-dehydrorhamnose reductase
MKLLITGAAGQLGKVFVSELKANREIQFSAYSRGDLDVTCVDEAQTVIARERPDFVINTAAYTQVDLAESEKDNAFLVNETGPANLAEVCKRLDIPLVHFSTDYVFDGSKKSPWNEHDATAPLGIYGASKLAGEKAITQIHSKHLIFRTSWVFSEYGHNFVKTMLHVGSMREKMKVVDDQKGKPTAAREIVRLILAILPKVDNQWGIYNLAQPQAVSWYNFAQAIFEQARSLDKNYWDKQLLVSDLQPIPSSEYPTHAQRPANSELDTAKLESTFGLTIKPWHESLNQTIGALQDND